MEQRLCELYKSPEEYAIEERFPGIHLKDLTYQPIFPYFAHLKQERRAFRVLVDAFVTSDQGTGVVHQAPYFGEVHLG
jgi:isoleucyl-tRNA synthetase